MHTQNSLLNAIAPRIRTNIAVLLLLHQILHKIQV
nr:MAG TPA_asm: hypothetical protein [Caudoviricetes sp.]